MADGRRNEGERGGREVNKVQEGEMREDGGRGGASLF